MPERILCALAALRHQCRCKAKNHLNRRTQRAQSGRRFTTDFADFTDKIGATALARRSKAG
jgi:hypothetical protein